VKPEQAKTPPLSPAQRLLLLDTWRRSGLPAGDSAALRLSNLRRPLALAACWRAVSIHGNLIVSSLDLYVPGSNNPTSLESKPKSDLKAIQSRPKRSYTSLICSILTPGPMR
jgi:hypothetical protein